MALFVVFSSDLCMAHATKFLHLSAQGKELPQLVHDSFTATKGACEHFQETNLLETTASKPCASAASYPLSYHPSVNGAARATKIVALGWARSMH